MRLFLQLFVFFTILVLAAAPAQACGGPNSEMASLLQSLPQNAEAEASTVAQVRIIEREGFASSPTVVVVRAFKGTEKGETFKVLTEGHSCAADIGAKIGDVVFVAGDFNDQGTLIGIWSGIYSDNAKRIR